MAWKKTTFFIRQKKQRWRRDESRNYIAPLFKQSSAGHLSWHLEWNETAQSQQ